MKQANPIYLAARLWTRSTDVMLSTHAHERSLERSSIQPSRVREMIAAREAVLLPWCSRERDADRTYHLMYDEAAGQFVVGILANGSPADPRSYVVTVLTRTQFENDVGPLSPRQLRAAAARVLDEVSFRRWESEEFAGTSFRRRFRVISYYPRDDRAEGTPPAHVVFQNAPVCAEFADEHSLSNAGAHPGFWDWYRREAERVGLPVERVVAIRIADTHKVKLDLAAELRECPCCVRRASEQNTH